MARATPFRSSVGLGWFVSAGVAVYAGRHYNPGWRQPWRK